MSDLADTWEKIAKRFREMEAGMARGEIYDCAFSPYEVVVKPDEAEIIAKALRAYQQEAGNADPSR